MIRCFVPLPRSRWYWMAILMAFSTASEPPETNQTRSNPGGANSSMINRAHSSTASVENAWFGEQAMRDAWAVIASTTSLTP